MTQDDGTEKKNKQDYEIGYGRPPKRSQFQPGQSGNPKGRKRRPQSVQVQMHAVVSKKVSITEGGQTKRIPILGVILRTFANKAAKGDLKAANFVFSLLQSPEYADTDTIDQTGLSPDDQAMFEEVMRQVLETDSSDQSILADTDDAASAPALTLPDDGTCRSTSSQHDEDDGDDTQV